MVAVLPTMLAIAMLEDRFTSGRGKELETHETMI